MAFEVGSIVSKLVLDLKNWKKNIAVAKGDAKKASKGFKGLSKSTMGLSSALTKGLAVAFVGAGAAAIKAAIDINSAMAKVGTLIPGNTERLKQLKAQIQALGPAMGKSTADLAGGLFQVISALGDTQDTMKILEINAKAAAAGMSTTEEAIRLTTAVTKGYGDTSEEAFKKAADLAFKTNELGQTTFPELASSMGKVIPVAAAMGVSQEELFATMATLTGVTGNAAEVSTQMSGVLRAMIKPTKDMQSAIKNLGFESGDALVQQLGLVNGMRALIKTTDGSKVAIGKLFRRAEALTSVFALTGGQAETFDIKLQKMKGSTGSLDKAFKEVTSGINKAGFSFEQIKVELAVVAQVLGEELLPMFQGFLDLIWPVIGSLKTIVPLVVDFGSVWFKAAENMESFTRILQGAAKFLNPLTGLFKKNTKEIIENTEVIIGLDLRLREAGASEKFFIKQSMAMYMAMGMSRQTAAQKVADSINVIEAVMGQALSRFGAKLGETKKTTQSFSERMKEMMAKLLADLKKGRVDDAVDTTEIMKQVSNRIKELTLDEFEFRSELARQKAAELDEEVAKSAGAAEKKKIIAQQLDLELAQIEADKKVRRDEIDEQEKAAGLEMMEFMKSIDLQRREASIMKQEQRLTELNDWRDAQLETLATMNIDWMAALLLKAEIYQAYLAKKAALDLLEEQKRKQMNQRIRDAAVSLGQNLLGLWGALIAGRLKKLNEANATELNSLKTSYEKRKKWIEENVKDEAEKKKQLEALEKEYNDTKSKLDEKHAKKALELKRKAAIADKAGAILGAIVNTAQAVTSALTNPFPLNFVLAALVGAAGAAQIATIVATPIPFSEGGITTGPTQGLVGEAGAEAIIPLEKLPEIFAEMGGAEAEGGGFGGSTNINITIAAMDSEDVAKFVDDKLIPILEDRFETQNFQVDPIAVRS